MYLSETIAKCVLCLVTIHCLVVSADPSTDQTADQSVDQELTEDGHETKYVRSYDTVKLSVEVPQRPHFVMFYAPW